MEIKDSAHAVRVLEALVEKVGKLSEKASRGQWEVYHYESPRGARKYDCVGSHDSGLAGIVHGIRTGRTARDVPFIAASRSLVPALVEGAKEILDDFEYWGKDFAHSGPIMRLANVYAPRMKEAGMEVPNG